MDKIKLLELTIATVVGSLFTIIGIITNSLLQIRQENIKNKLLEQSENKKQKIAIQQQLINDIKEIHLLLSSFKDNHTLTSSYIDSFVKLTPEEYSIKYKDSFNQIAKLKLLVDINFPELHDEIERIDGLINIYWGNHHNLLRIDINVDKNEYDCFLKNIIEVSNVISSEISQLKFYLINMVKKIKENNAT